MKGVIAMKIAEMLYEGKAKQVFATEDPNVVMVHYKDDATAFNGLKKGTISGKGAINNRITNIDVYKRQDRERGRRRCPLPWRPRWGSARP